MELEGIVIDEQIYQQFKQDMGKTDDYFTIEEWEKLCSCCNVS